MTTDRGRPIIARPTRVAVGSLQSPGFGTDQPGLRSLGRNPDAGPNEIENAIARQRAGEISEDELKKFLQSLSPQAYQAWASSTERVQGGSGSGATGLSALAPLAAPVAGAGVAAAGIATMLGIGRPGGDREPRQTREQSEASFRVRLASPAYVEQEVDRRHKAALLNGSQMSRAEIRDQVYRDVNTMRSQSRPGFGFEGSLLGFVVETGYRPFASVAGLLSGEDPMDSVRQAWEGLAGDDPLSKQLRNAGFIRLLPDNDFLPFDLSARDVAGGVADLGLDIFMTAKLAKTVRAIKTGQALGIHPTPLQAVADLPTPQEFAADIGGASVVARGVNRVIPIDPSTLLDTELGRLALGYKRAEVASEGLTSVALAPLDSWSRRFTGRAPFGRNGWLFKTDRFGNLENVVPKASNEIIEQGTGGAPSGPVSRAWNDVFSNPDGYLLTAEQRRYVDEVIDLVDQVDQMRVRAGLPSRAKDTSPDGWFYVPRTVTQLNDLIVHGRTDPGQIRKYEEMAEGMANGVRYETDLRAVLESHIRNAYHEVNYHRLDEAVQAQAIAPARVQRGGEFAWVRVEGAAAASTRRGNVLRQFRQTIDRIEEITRQGGDLDATTRQQLADAERRVSDAEFNIARMRAIDPDETGMVPTGPVVLDEAGNVLDALPSGLDPFDEAQRIIDEATAEIVRIWQRTSGGQDFGALDDAIARASALGDEAAELGALARQTERIRVGNWRETWLPENVAEEMNRIAPKRPDQANALASGFQTLGDAVRFNSAVGDFAAPFLQGLPALFRDPATWARSTYMSYMSILDPTVMTRHIRDNIDVYQRMAQNGVPVGDNEFFAGLARGRNTNVFGLMQNMVRRLPGDLGDDPHMVLGAMKNQSYGRFQAVYDSFLASSRSMMWQGLETGWERRGGGSLMNLGRHIRNMTGGLDTRALGVSANQRGFESTWLAFAPRYTRSVGALVAEMFDSNPAVRTEAIRAVVQTMAGVHGLFFATGLAMGKSQEEIIAALNPLSGKEYLSFQMGNGDWVGVGGTIRSMTQTVAAAAALGADVITDPSRLADMNLGDTFNANTNPFLRFAEGRAAPGQTILRAGIEYFTSKTGSAVDALPFEDINSLPDIVRFLGTSMLPFAAQGRLEGEDLSTSAFALGGLRTSAETPNEKKTAILDLGVRAMGLGPDFETVAAEYGEPAMRQRIREHLVANDPAALAEFDRLEDERFEQYRRDKLIRRDPIAIAVLAGVDAREAIIGLVNETPTDLQAIREGATRELIEARAVREQDFVQAALEKLPQSDTEPQQDLDRYFDVLDIDNAAARDEAEAALRNDLGPERYSRVLSNVFAVSQPMPDQWTRIQDGKRQLTEAGFFEFGEPAWRLIQDALRDRMDTFSGGERAVAEGVLNTGDFQTWYESEVDRQQERLIAEDGMEPEEARTRAKNLAQRYPVTGAFDDAMLKFRVEWAQANPELAREAYALGYLQGSDLNTVISGALGVPDADEAEASSAPVIPTADIVEAYVAGADYGALAEQFGISVEAVRSRLRRAANGRSPETLR